MSLLPLEQQFPEKKLSENTKSSSEAFERLFSKEYPIRQAMADIERYLRRLERDEHRREDIVQETMLQAYRKAHLFRGDSSLKTWLCTIARNILYMFRKKEAKREPMSRLEDETDVDVIDPEQPEILIMRRETLADIRDVLRNIDPLFYEYIVEGKTIEELADEHRKTRKAVKSQLHRSRVKVQEVLEKRNIAA